MQVDGFRLQKLMFPYEWLDGYEKLSHVGQVGCEDFYNSLAQFLKVFQAGDCSTVGDWLAAGI